MRTTLVTRIAFLAAALALGGCSKNQLACNDEAPLSLVRTIAIDAALEQIQTDTPLFASEADAATKLRPLLESADISIADTMTTAIDKDTGRITCSAVVTINVPEVANKWKEHLVDQFLKVVASNDVKRDGATFSHRVSYTAQRTDDSNKIYVSVSDGLPIAQVMASRAIIEHMSNNPIPLTAPAGTAEAPPPPVEEIEGAIFIDMNRAADIGMSEVVVGVDGDPDAVAIVRFGRGTFDAAAGPLVRAKCESMTTVAELGERYQALKDSLPATDRVHMDCTEI